MCVLYGAVYQSGSITIENQSGTNATVAGKTLNIFKIFDATTNGENISYQWVEETDGTNRYETFFFGGEGKYGVTHDRLLPASAKTIHDVVEYINGLKDNSFEFSQMAAKLHQYIHDEKIAYTKTSGQIDSDATSYTFDNLSIGYYLVYDATEIVTGEAAVRSAAMLTHPGENKTIKLKADRPHIEKQVDDRDVGATAPSWQLGTTASIGETVTFRIITMIPDHDLYGDNYKFVITDSMDDNLELDVSSITVRETKPTASTTVVANYKLETDASALEAGQDFSIEFTNVPDLDTDTLIEITYNAKVLATAGVKNINTATLTYSNDPHEVTSMGHVNAEAAVMLWQFTLTKHMEDANGTPSFIRLPGAEFEIYSKAANGALTKLSFSEEVLTNSNNVNYTKYILNPAGTVQTLKTVDENGSDDGKTDVGYTDGGYIGQILIWGLGEGTYVIRETKAPAGYQIAKGDFEFTISDTIGISGAVSNAVISEATRTESPGQFTRVSISESNLKYYIGITNAPGSALPETGGMGTTLFTFIGIILMAGAISFFSTRKRNSLN